MNKLLKLCIGAFAAAVFLCALSLQAYAAEETTTEPITGYCGAITDEYPKGENIKYTISDNGTKLTISGSGAMAGYYDINPPYIDYIDTLTTLVFEEGSNITHIGDSAFYNFKNLTGDLVIPNSVTSIGDSAFFDCKSFNGKLIIPDSVTVIRDCAFVRCGFTEISIGKSVTWIGECAFESCTNLSGNLLIPKSVIVISECAFIFCTSLTSVTIEDGVESIGNNVFDGCTALTSVNIPSTVTSIGSNVFNGCSNLTSIDIASNDTNVINSLLSSGTSITEIPELTILNKTDAVEGSTLAMVKKLRCFKGSAAYNQDLSSYTAITRVPIQDQSSALITIPKPTNGEWIQKVELIITKDSQDKAVELTQYKEAENGDYIFPVIMYANSYIDGRSLPCKARYYYSYVNQAATDAQLTAAVQGSVSDNTSSEITDSFNVYWKDISLNNAEFAITEEGLIDVQ